MQDPLDTNVSDIKTGYPVIGAGLYDLRVEEVKKEPTKDGSGERLTIALKTTQAAVSLEGEPVGEGHQITHYIGLTPKTASEPGKRDYTMTDVAKGIASIAKAAGLVVTPRQIIDNPSILQGKVVRAKVKVQKETAEFPASNRVGDFVEIK